MPQHTARLNAAIRTCLQRCYGSKPPIDVIAEFILELRADPAWTDRDVLEVETAVRRILRLIVEEPAYPERDWSENDHSG
jgi:hypothetical protein